MHIVVPVKQVPDTDELRYDPSTRTLVRDGVELVINAYDKRALTEALRLRDLYGGSVTAITMGPPQARAALVECLGRGVDRCVHLTDRAFAGADTLATARTLAAALRRLSFDLILAGKFSTDSETGQVGPELAELIDLPQVTGATRIELEGDFLLVERENDLGFERVRLALPALLTAAERLIKPVKTRPHILEEGARRLQADPALIETWGADDLGLPVQEVGLSGSPTWVAELRPVVFDRARIVLEGEPQAQAHRLLALLAERLQRPRNAAEPGRPRHEAKDARASGEGQGRSSIWVVAEMLRQGQSARLRPVSLELASGAARLAPLLPGGEAEVWAVLAGHFGDRVELQGWAKQLAAHGATHLALADHHLLGHYSAESYAWILARAIEQWNPGAILFPATSFGRDLAPRLAARLGLGLTGDCTGLEVDPEGRVLALKPAFGGAVLAPIVSRTRPALATVRPGALRAEALRPPDWPARVVELSTSGLRQPRVQLLSTSYEGEGGLALDTARLVVCVGTGIGGPQALPAVERLARSLGRWMGLRPEEVAIGGTRKAVDEGWLPSHQQIGITGRYISPDLYLGLGLAGNFNHTAGIMRSHTIVAVNSDPSAQIFEACDVGVVARWEELTPALLSLLARAGMEFAEPDDER